MHLAVSTQDPRCRTTRLFLPTTVGVATGGGRGQCSLPVLLKLRLHDATCCQTGCSQTGLTTGCIVKTESNKYHYHKSKAKSKQLILKANHKTKYLTSVFKYTLNRKKT